VCVWYGGAVTASIWICGAMSMGREDNKKKEREREMIEENERKKGEQKALCE